MSKAKERLEQRLSELPSDVLADVLLRHTRDKPALRRELMVMTSDADELASAVKRSIAGLRRSTAFYSFSQAKKLVRKLDDLVAQIQNVAETSPSTAFELTCQLLATEDHVQQNVDDSDGGVGDVYRRDLPNLAALIAALYEDYEHMAKWLCVALEEDPFGSRCFLVDTLVPFVPTSVMESLNVYVTRLLNTDLDSDTNAGASRYRSKQHSFVHRRILVAINNPEHFIAACSANGTLQDRDILTLVNMFINHKDYASADLWLQKIHPDHMIYMREAGELQLLVDKALGRTADVITYLRDQFLASPSHATHQNLAQFETAGNLDALLTGLVQSIASISDPSPNAIRFLIDVGKGAEMEIVVALRDTTAFVNYTSWPGVAKSFEQAGYLVGASMAYRILMEDILNRTRAKAYPHAVRYYFKLWALARLITNWRGIPDNDSYMKAIAKRHALKSSFWRQVHER